MRFPLEQLSKLDVMPESTRDVPDWVATTYGRDVPTARSKQPTEAIGV